MKRFINLLIVLLLLHMSIACADDNSSKQTLKPSEIVDLYIAKTRGWKKSDYRLIVYSRETNIIVYKVIHRDDESPKLVDTWQSGGGKSLEIKIDLDSMTVIDVLGFQQ